MKEKIIIAGGSGFFGSYLCNYFSEKHDVIVLTRGKSYEKNGISYQHWDGKTIGDWNESLDGSKAIINLSGKSINCRFTDENKKALINSRVDSTRILAQAIKNLDKPPKFWLNASAGAMYVAGEKPNTEKDKSFSDSFLSKMALAWEEAFYKDELPKTKRASLRISLILGREGGVFPVWKKLTKYLLGGTVGSGKQMVSWMHIEDAAKAIDFIMANELEGVFNFSTNQPVSNKVLMKSFQKTFNIPFGFWAPAFMIKLFSPLIGVDSSLVLNGVNFVPDRLLKAGYQFKYEDINKALEDLK